jgi:hypothetical protein
MLGQDRGREGAERLAVLHLGVEDVLGIGGARIGDDRAVAERARAELGAALHPADQLALGQELGGDGRDLIGSELAQALFPELHARSRGSVETVEPR